MSDSGDLVVGEENAVLTPQEQRQLKPLYQLFTNKFVTLLLLFMLMISLSAILLYQHNSQINSLAKNQLTPLTKQLQQVKTLQVANLLISDLLNSKNAERFVEQHKQLIALDRQLLTLNYHNAQQFRQWLHANENAENIVSRIQDSYTRNQQLKQSSIIQLQLILFSMRPIIEKKLADQNLLDKQLQADQARDRVTFSRANAYAKLAQQLTQLQQMNFSFVQILTRFEKLAMHSSIVNFESLRNEVEQALRLTSQLNLSDETQAVLEVSQQIATFEKIVISEQRALAKWQGYLRLTHEYFQNLKPQQAKITELLQAPIQKFEQENTSIITPVLAKINVQLSHQQITLILYASFLLTLLISCYVLWRLRKKIQLCSQQSIEIIKENTNNLEDNVLLSNCTETEQVISLMQGLSKPAHNEKEFQHLTNQYQKSQKKIEQKNQETAQLHNMVVQVEKSNEKLQLDTKEQIDACIGNEALRYSYLNKAALILVQQQSTLLQEKTAEIHSRPREMSLATLQQRLTQFQLAVEVQSDKSVLQLNDINLLNEIHAALFSKQKQLLLSENQLFIKCDEQLLTQAKIDSRLFMHFINLLIDITLADCCDTHWYLQLQLQDKNVGQQLVRFIVSVKNEPLDKLPELITQLVASQTNGTEESALINIFALLFAKQHGENIDAQLTDEGYQLSFELPLAIVTLADSDEKVIFEHRKIMLLSNNLTLAEVIENSVRSVKGDFEHLTRIDSFQQQLTPKHLKRQKLDILVVDSKMAAQHFALINQQIEGLPHSLQPKLLVLQSPELSYKVFGLYSQVEQVLCKDSFLHSMSVLLEQESMNNHLMAREEFEVNQFRENDLTVLLAVNSPQRYQTLYRLLNCLGLQVQCVAHQAGQQMLWQTGQYSLLITEFSDTAFIEMESKPLVDIAVFSLTDDLPQANNVEYFNKWHLGKLSQTSSLTELVNALAPWLKPVPKVDVENIDLIEQEHGFTSPVEEDDVYITEVAQVLMENEKEAVFDFSQYLKHQGTVELALFMLDDYSQENHMLLDDLVESIKAKDIAQAKLSTSALMLNAKILSAKPLQSLCVRWSKLLNGKDTASSLKKVNALLKETRIALNEIDEFAEAI